MKRARSSLGKRIPPVLLFWDDLSAIAEALTQNNGKLNLKTEKYEYDSLDELYSNREDNLRGLSLYRDTPYISVDFDSRSGVWLYAANDDLISRGIFAEIQEFLEPKRRLSYSVVHRFVEGARWVGAFGFGAFAATGHWREAILLLLIMPVSIAFLFAKGLSIINRESRAQAKNFWQRNSDQIVVALIAALASSILTLVATALFLGGKP